MEGRELNMHSLRSMGFSSRMDVYERLHLASGQQRLVLSRSPLRKLLRHISPVDTTFRWLTSIDQPQSLPFDVDAVIDCLIQWCEANTGVVFVEGMDMLFDAQGPEALFSMMSTIDRLASTNESKFFFILDPLAFPSNVWTRLSPIVPEWMEPTTTLRSPALPVVVLAIVGELEHPLVNLDQTAHDRMIAQLVALPRAGFNGTLLSKRMLQWRRMGFDLSDLEPAISATDMDRAYDIYASVETKIRTATDALLELER
ncbi:MAG: DUF835 domain-containing protein, partial [Flavobacteriales bacterium]|nr:DUF835 domain-containing protein [Flavobacteriales bacterium]